MPSPRRRRQDQAPSESAPITVNGWAIYAHPLFIDQLEALAGEVEHLRAADPAGYRQKKKTKLLAAIYKMAFEVIPQTPRTALFFRGILSVPRTAIGIGENSSRDAIGCSFGTRRQRKPSCWRGLTTRRRCEPTGARPTLIRYSRGCSFGTSRPMIGMHFCRRQRQAFPGQKVS